MKNCLLSIFIVIIIFMNNNVMTYAQENWFAKGQKELSENNFEKAITYFTKEIEANPKNAFGFYYRGIAYLYTDKTEKAIKDFNKAVKLEPRNSDVYNSRGLAYSFMPGKTEEALSDFTNAIKYDSKNSQAYFNRGNIYLNQEKLQEALQDYNKSIASDSSNPAAFMQRGNNYYALEMFPQAISDFDKAIKMGLKISKIYYNRGNAHFRAKNYESALEDYNKVLGFDSTDLETLNNRAMAYDKLGDTLKAKEDRQRLAILSGNANKFPDLNSLHFVTYVADGGEYAINMPDNWLKFVNNTDDVKEMIITHDSIESFEEPYAVGIKLSFNKNMFKNFKVKTVDDIMQFWKDSDDLNAKDYFDYRRMEETYFTRKNGYKGIQRTIQIHIKKEMIPLVLYEYAVAKEDVLFYAYFQAPVSEWGYYKQIFDKAIKSLAIK